MKKAIRCILAFTLLVFLGQPASALIVGDLYKLCKPYADSGYIATTPGDIACLSYINGFTEAQAATCGVLRNGLKAGDITKNGVIWLSKDFAASYVVGVDSKAAVQAFTNWAGNNPAKWNEQIIFDSKDWLAKNFPCEAEQLIVTGSLHQQRDDETHRGKDTLYSVDVHALLKAPVSELSSL